MSLLRTVTADYEWTEVCADEKRDKVIVIYCGQRLFARNI